MLKAIDKDRRSATSRPTSWPRTCGGSWPMSRSGRGRWVPWSGRGESDQGAGPPRRRCCSWSAPVAALALVGAGVALIYSRRLEVKNVQLAKAFERTDQALAEAEYQRVLPPHRSKAAAGWREGEMLQVEKLLEALPDEPALLEMALPQETLSCGIAHTRRTYWRGQLRGVQLDGQRLVSGGTEGP